MREGLGGDNERLELVEDRGCGDEEAQEEAQARGQR